MSTSPSWFDQDKFSRLVKKVGAKAAAGTTPAAPSAPRPPKEIKRQSSSPEAASTVFAPSVKASQPIQRAKTSSLPSGLVSPAETARETPETEESLPDFPLALTPPEPRSVSPLSKRTTPLPDLKSLFEYEKPAAREQTPAVSEREEKELETIGPKQIDSEEEAISDLPSSEAAEEIPSPYGDSEASSENLEELLKERDELAARVDELSQAAQERDDARREAALLRDRLLENEPGEAAPEASSEEVARALEDRDNARRDYIGLREQFETLKQDHIRLRSESARKSPVNPEELESLRTQLIEREEELNALKLDPMGTDPEIDSLREEADVLHKQLNQAKEEALIAQRGLALSQKALQETRDALRESTEGSSQMKASFESLKNECATLVQQNMLLQAQHDQLSREIATLKLKNTGKVQPST